MKHGLKNEKSLNMDQDALVDPRLLKEIKCSTNFLHSPIQTTCSVLCAVSHWIPWLVGSGESER